MSHHLEHHYRSENEKKAALKGCFALFFFLALGTLFVIGLFWFAGLFS